MLRLFLSAHIGGDGVGRFCLGFCCCDSSRPLSGIFGGNTLVYPADTGVKALSYVCSGKLATWGTALSGRRLNRVARRLCFMSSGLEQVGAVSVLRMIAVGWSWGLFGHRSLLFST